MTSGTLSPGFRSVSLLAVLAFLPCASRAQEHEVGEAGRSNGPFGARRLAGLNVTEIADVLRKLPDDEQRALQKALNVDSNECPDSIIGRAICEGQKFIGQFVQIVFANSVSYPAAFILTTVVNTVGQWSTVIVANYSWNAWPSSIVVLNMFFKKGGLNVLPQWISKNPVLCTLFFSAFQAALQSWFASTKKGVRTRLELSRREAEVEDTINRTHVFVASEEVHLPPLDGSTDMIVGNRYQELTHPFIRVLALFMVQSALFLFFMYELHENAALHYENAALHSDSPSQPFCKWFVAVGIVFVVSEGEQLGGVYDGAYWRTVLSVEVKTSDSESDSSDDEKQGLSEYWSRQCHQLITLNAEWNLRRSMSFLVNGVYRAIILCLAPILLSQATELNFIKDSLAVFFITTLDDLSEKKSMVREIAYSVCDDNPDVGAWCKKDKRPPLLKQADIASEFKDLLNLGPENRPPASKIE